MITVKNAEFASFLVASILAYLMITIFSGYVQAWIAKKLGDTTAQELGFLSFNPLVYIDYFGFFCFLAFGFGWGTIVPINPYNFKGKHKRLEYVFTFASRPLVLCFLALVCLTIMVCFLGGLTSMYSSSIRPFPIPRYLLDHTSLQHALRLVFGLMADYSIFFTFYSVLIATIRAFLLYEWRNQDSPFLSLEAEMMVLIACFMFLYFFAEPLSYLLILLIRHIELWLWLGWSWIITLSGLISMYS